MGSSLRVWLHTAHSSWACFLFLVLSLAKIFPSRDWRNQGDRYGRKGGKRYFKAVSLKKMRIPALVSAALFVVFSGSLCPVGGFFDLLVRSPALH
ncbi:hypothetical protein VTJ04DRAFT_819 [Mycothermus thermophilus]|uniref:uncharacterized protein n=1 Tax=Humicola insolens TaxID=85995 RepID=UPI00374298B2